MSKTIKKILIFGAVAIVLAAVVFIFVGKTKPEGSGTASGLSTAAGNSVSTIVNPRPASAVEASAVGQEFINQLVSLQAIKLDDSVFSSLGFQALEDFTIILVQPGNEGRPNPFAPFGADGIDPNAPDPSSGGINVTPLPTDGTPLPTQGNS